MEKFIYAGIDFIFDKNLNPYFLEANSCSGLLRWNEVYGNFEPLEKLSEYIKAQGCKIIAILTRKSRYEDVKHRLFCNTVKNVFQKVLETHICFHEDNKENVEKNSNRLLDVNNNLIEFDSVFMTVFLPNYSPNMMQINPPSITKITRDKWLCYQAIERYKRIRCPKSFFLKSPEELRVVINQHRHIFQNGIVLKPRIGESGRGVYVLENVDDAHKIPIRRSYIAQEKIPVKRANHDFWDVRSFVIGGKFVGAIKRVSDNPVVNLSFGGDVRMVEDEIVKKIDRLSKICVKIIENVSNFLSSKINSNLWR